MKDALRRTGWDEVFIQLSLDLNRPSGSSMSAVPDRTILQRSLLLTTLRSCRPSSCSESRIFPAHSLSAQFQVTRDGLNDVARPRQTKSNRPTHICSVA
jgi:hypothetical protein